MKNTVVVEMNCDFGKFQNQTMNTTIWANDQKIWSGLSEQDSCNFKFDFKLPGCIIVEVNGKNQFDTQVDDSGKIIADKNVLIRSMSFDGIWVKKWMMENRVWKFQPTLGTERFTNYFGYNGRGILKIEHQDILDFWLDCHVID